MKPHPFMGLLILNMINRFYHARNIKPMKGLGETSPFHRFTYPQHDKSFMIGHELHIYFIDIVNQFPGKLMFCLKLNK